uniref:Putative inorganic phosphate cotransporter n=1 Tax=Clastoptera arizonana TaxID=38151 RepID=A0A1B6E1K5_9HEMI
MDPNHVQHQPNDNPGFGVRHKQAIMAFFAQIVAYSMRVNLSVAIVAMTDNSSNPNFPELNWDPATKGTILSSFFWGYMITQIPAGNIARIYGPKPLLFGSLLLCGIITILTPLIALKTGWLIFCFSRVLQGMFQGCVYPSVNTLLAKWAPPTEKSRIFSFVFSGTQAGTVLALFISGYLASSAGGWPSIFYITGSGSIVWAILWLWLGSNSPDNHPTISDEEKDYIISSLLNSSSNANDLKTPWKEIATSVPLWALLITHCGQNWGFWTLLTLMPSYMSHALGFDIKSNGLLSSLPYLSMFVLSIVLSWLGDYLTVKKILPISIARKMWNSIAFWGGAVALVFLAMYGSNVVVAVTLLTISVALNGTVYMGYLCNHLDLSPNFAGLLMGITNGFANVTSILAPIVAGFIVNDESNIAQWRIVFYISALVFFLGNSIFILFGSTEVQYWNEPRKKQGMYKQDK